MRVTSAALFALFLTVPTPSLSQEADDGYEARLEEWGLGQVGAQRELEPEGKPITAIRIASEDVVAKSDPWPNFVNIFHRTTREHVIRQELLFATGETYDPARVEETARILRSLGIFAIVRMVPIKAEGGVGLLVVTKDLWSIRLNISFNLVGTLLQSFSTQPSEQNFLGLDKQLAGELTLRLDTVALGQSYSDRRILGSRLSLSEGAALILNRETGKLEGSRGSASVGRPLYRLDDKWGFSVGAGWNVHRARVYRGADVWQLPYGDSGTVDANGAPVPLALLPFVYDVREISGSGVYTRSFGYRFKTNVSAGYGGYTRRYTPSAPGLTSDERAFLIANDLPRSENATYFLATVNSYEATYRVLRNVATFALSEDYQIGHSAVLAVRWAHPYWGSPSQFVEAGAALRYRWYLADDLLTVSTAAATRNMPSALARGEAPSAWVNRHAAAELVNVTPNLLFGRLVTRALIDVVKNDLGHRVVLLGGGNGLRGTAPDEFSGRQIFLTNVEYRTKPVELKTFHVGGVLFWDSGSAFTRSLSLTHTVGIGLRMLFPQFDVSPIRVDFGYVLNGASPPIVDRFSASHGQVTDFGSSFLDSPLD